MLEEDGFCAMLDFKILGILLVHILLLYLEEDMMIQFLLKYELNLGLPSSENLF